MVSIKDLLCRNVGLGTFSGDGIWCKSTLSSQQVVCRIQYVLQAYEFRDGCDYSNHLFITAGDLIEKVTDKSFK